mmetsp:Transcript_33352/g.51124  ORF Transcript_33352/g.51124 Transcript_33352/m.51124 type:complete len:135 (+) Transcript_33352:1157-1561(+)
MKQKYLANSVPSCESEKYIQQQIGKIDVGAAHVNDHDLIVQMTSRNYFILMLLKHDRLVHEDIESLYDTFSLPKSLPEFWSQDLKHILYQISDGDSKGSYDVKKLVHSPGPTFLDVITSEGVKEAKMEKAISEQ